MLLQDVKAQVFKLSPSDRLALVTAIIESLQSTLVSEPERSSAIHQMRGLLVTEQPAPADSHVVELLGQRRLEKYSQ